MKRTAPLAFALAAALAAAATSVGAPAAAQEQRRPPRADRHFYGTKTPYAPQQDLHDYQPVPRGFTPVFTENVARHGSRAMTDPSDGRTVLAVLQAARAQDGLTRLGERLDPQVRALLAGAAALGWGSLSARGAEEQRQTALRMEQRLPALFHDIEAGRRPITVETSGVARAVASANAFTAGLAAGDPALAGLIRPPVTDRDLLYFHKQPQNADYRAYLAGDPELAAVLAEIDGEPGTARAAGHVVARLFRPGFAAAMAGPDRVAFGRALYQLYGAAPDLRAEAPGVDLDPFLPAEDARWFAYLDDAEEFYQKGPAFRGRTITYGMAHVLLDDLFARAEAAAAGTGGSGAVLRFTHAEEIEPLAVLLGLPGSTRPAAPDDPYAYRTNPWRGAEVAPMAANVQWDVFAGPRQPGRGTDGGGTDGRPAEGTRYLVRMLYNERETAFPASCRPIDRGSFFYDLAELERCFGRG
ncbi:histidine-type phosphatase [Kitasatospora sp. NPDC059571]|uniref:histidine-type phosphatase n=1 Tax=Kitasatospora sp. NPDC059571 TaxID=3346871 RepID=UPI0036A338A8